MRIYLNRTVAPLVLLCLAALMPLGFAAPAYAGTIGLTATPAAPIVGQEVTFDAVASMACNQWTWTFTVDGVAMASDGGDGSSTAFKRVTFTTAGSHTVVAAAVNGDCELQTPATQTIVVGSTTGGSISTNPDPPVATQSVELGAVPAGGFAPYTYAWDSDNNGTFDNETTRTITRTYPAAGAQTVRVQVTDSATPANQWVITRTLEVNPYLPPASPTASPSVSPSSQPTPPPCTRRVTFGLSELTTTGCFSRTLNQWSTTSEVKLNSLSLGDLGQTVTITLPTDAEPGGHVAVGNASLVVGDTAVYSGAVDWALPAGGAGEEQAVKSLAVPAFAQYVGLKVVGSAALRIGLTSAGAYYTSVSLGVGLPLVFGSGSDVDSGRVTLTGSVRVDASGPHFEGMQLRGKDIYVGRGMKLHEVCFSAVPGGGQSIAPCPAPTLDGQPYLECATDTAVDRWEITGVLQYPDPMNTQLAVFGALSGGQLTRLGGFINDSDIPLRLGPGIAVNRIGAGVCLNPPPLKVRGDIGAKIAEVIQINGRVVYTDPTRTTPWTTEIGGNVSVADVQLGDGSVTFDDTGQTSFAVQSEANVLDAVTLTGALNGWVEPANNRFNLNGSVRGCLVDVICAKAMALVSSAGLAGCIDVGTLVVYEPVNARTSSWEAGTLSFNTRRVEVPLKAGFGYKYGTSSVDLLGNSCDFGPYSASRASSARLAASSTALARVDMVPALDAALAPSRSVRIAPGTQAVTLLVRGSSGAPKIVLRGPGGTMVKSSATKPGVRTGRSVIAENSTNGTTSVLLTKPAVGIWTISALPGSKSRPTSVARSSVQAPPMFISKIRSTKKGQDLVVAYAAPKGAKVQLVERGTGVGTVIAPKLKGHSCGGEGPKTLNGQRVLCARVQFQPTDGVVGKRTIEAIVTNGGIPLAPERVATFKVTV